MALEAIIFCGNSDRTACGRSPQKSLLQDLPHAVARVTMGKVAARSKVKKIDACVMCKTFRAPHAMTHGTSDGRRKRWGM